MTTNRQSIHSKSASFRKRSSAVRHCDRPVFDRTNSGTRINCELNEVFEPIEVSRGDELPRSSRDTYATLPYGTPWNKPVSSIH